MRVRPALCLGAAGLLVLVTAPLSASATVAPSGYRVHDYADGQVMSILPPGNNGLVNATDLAAFEATGARPAGSTDQRTKYDALNYASTITTSSLPSYYDDESFGVRPADVLSTVTPEAGLTIITDTKREPHVYADSDATLAFGSGYAQAADRLFLMDVLRHYGSGTTSAFLGPSCADEQMDHDQLLIAPYTAAQATAQVSALPKEYGAQGARAKVLIDNYVQGINAYIAAAEQDPTLLPADYGVTGVNAVPQPWVPADVVSVAGLVGGIFGRGGGTEVANGALLTYLQGKLGASGGMSAFTAFKSAEDPSAPTTVVDERFPYLDGPGLSSSTPTALNDLAAVDPTTHLAVLTGGPADTTPNCDLTKPDVQGLLDVSSLENLPKAFSNALTVTAAHSRSGHPLAVFGPQLGYYAPEIVMQEDLHSPDYDAEGVSFPGTGLVELGRGQDFAWSATTAGGDLIDQRMEVACNPTGGAVSATQPDYLFDGTCLPMTHETFSETGLPSAAGTGAPATIDHEVYLTRHGIVQGWTKDTRGRVVAVADQRSTYGHDVDSVLGFLAWGTPSLTHDVTSWMHGASQIGYSFNWFYVDDRDTGYFSSGTLPVRPVGLDPDLPTLGTGVAEWKGYLPADQHVHEVNPPQGYFVSWNNKPAPGFAAADDQYGYGDSFRSIMLSRQIDVQFAQHGGRLDRGDLVTAMMRGGQQDLDGLNVVPALLAYLQAHPAPAGTPARDQTLLELLQTWVDTGARRHKTAEADTQYAQAAAVAISDELVPALVHTFFDTLLAGPGQRTGIVAEGNGPDGPSYTILPMQFVNTPHSGHFGSAYDSGYEGYLDNAFGQLSGRKVGAAFPASVTGTFCGTGPAACPDALWKTVTAVGAALETANGSATPASWTASTASASTAQPPSATAPTGTPAQAMPVYDDIQFAGIGIVGQTPLDWQNRPTFQQVVEFPRHRARASATPTRPRHTAAAPGAPLATTGGLPLAGLAMLVLVAGLLVHRRRGVSRP